MENTAKITNIFFDLDRTLWDFETNSMRVLKRLYREYSLAKYYPAFELFLKKYKEVNELMWQQYYRQEISKEEVRFLRFYYVLKEDKILSEELSTFYLEQSIFETAVFPNTISTLEYLQASGYKLHIITNGFQEVQYHKLANSNLLEYFDTVTTSEETGYHKPDLRTFQFALNKAKTTANLSAMVGDDLVTDISGAIQSGMLSIYFNPKRVQASHQATYEISDLALLKKIF